MTDREFAILRAVADREEEGRIRSYQRLRRIGAVISEAVRRAEAAERLDVLLRLGRWPAPGPDQRSTAREMATPSEPVPRTIQTT